MRIEVGKKYKCGDYVIGIIYYLENLDPYNFLGEYWSGGKSIYGTFGESGDHNWHNDERLCLDLQEIEDEKEGPILKIEPGKIHPFLFVWLKINADVEYISSFFLSDKPVQADGFSGYIHYKSINGDELTINKDTGAISLLSCNSGSDSIKSIYSDAAEAYEAYKKEVEGD